MPLNRDYTHQWGGGSLRVRPSFWLRCHIDVPLLLMLIVTGAGGLVVLYSASGMDRSVVLGQFSHFMVGLVGMLVLAQIEPRRYVAMAPWLYAAGLASLVAVALIGTGAKGAQRWLDLPGLPRFQPSEAMKLILPMSIAAYLNGRSMPPRFRQVLVSLTLVVIPVVFIARQPDLGTSLLIAASGLLVLWLAALGWNYIGGFLALAGMAMPLLWYAMHDYQRQRVLTLFDLGADPLGAGWNINQSIIAIGSGGIHGKGWGHGTQSQLDFLPESHTDFIIAVLAEEFGLIGVLALLVSYLILIARGLYIGICAQDTFSRLLAGSITLTLFVYVFVNICMVSGILPVVGVPLPLVSYGGTAIVILMAGFGMLMSIHTHRKFVI